MKLYVDVEKIKGERITTFLKKCYDIEKHNFKFKKTYFDKELSKIQCYEANRSFEDLYRLIKTYYPNCSKKHFAKQLEKILLEKSLLRLLYCTEINKWVFMNICFMNNSSKNYKYLYNYSDSEEKLNKKGEGEYTYYNIMSLMGYSKKQCGINL